MREVVEDEGAKAMVGRRVWWRVRRGVVRMCLGGIGTCLGSKGKPKYG